MVEYGVDGERKPLTADEYEVAYNTGRAAGIRERELRVVALQAAVQGPWKDRPVAYNVGDILSRAMVYEQYLETGGDK